MVNQTFDMPTSNSINVKDWAYSVMPDVSQIDGSVLGTNDGPSGHDQHATNYGVTSQVPPNEMRSSNDLDAQNQSEPSYFYPDSETLFNRKLTLDKLLKTPFDIRYKSNYFAYSGKNHCVPQPLRSICTIDGDPEITIKLPTGFIKPPNPGDFFLESTFLTVPRLNQYHIHANKFQQNHTDFSVLDENPVFLQLTDEHFDNGEIKVKLVPIKTLRNALKNIPSLPLFAGQLDPNEVINCKSAEDLNEIYSLNRTVIAFSLGYWTTDGQFTRFPNTTVLSNEIVEKETSPSIDDVTCPNCSHQFSFQVQKKKGQKRSAPTSDSPKKKRLSQVQKIDAVEGPLIR